MGQAQETLYANENYILTLFFPSPIRQAITGAEHFTFSYNQGNGQHFGLLQANSGDASNLLVITQDGRVYSYLLAYRKEVQESFRFVDISKSIGRETETAVINIPVDKLPVQKTVEPPKAVPNQELWKKGAEYILDRKTKILRSRRNDGLVLRLKELFYHQDEVYLEMEVVNRSEIDLELEVLEVYRINGKKGRRSSHQKVPMVPKMTHVKPEIVRTGQRQNFVYVLPKFTLGSSERLLLELQEAKGNRMIRLMYK